MGLLDDAIREHLDLKRRHGADPIEVERQEREALGPVQRGEFAQPAPAASEAEFDAPPAPREEPIADTPPDVPAPPEMPEAPEAGHPAAAPGYDEDPWLDDQPDEVPVSDALDHARPVAEPPAAPRDREPEPGPARPDEPRGDDVLEETPDFLEDTPEHERLWFEQRPPRDFDWDK
jgi:hypothetical protein